ncbi:MAG TPA: glycerate kinase [Ramlibacter sp.]|nr:glycerate kinase [Ramlibacter sp.]
MDIRKILVGLAALALIFAGWYEAAWPGVAFAVGAIVMIVLVQFSKMMGVLNRAARSPKGRVGSAVMLNAKLRKGVNLLHVMAMTRSIGEPLSAEGADPEFFRWTDDGGSSVTCEFSRGKLVKWSLERP